MTRSSTVSYTHLPYYLDGGQIRTKTNHAGGINGGITNGMPLILTAVFRPTPSIAKPQQTINLVTGQPTEFTITGRHDPCIVHRAVPVLSLIHIWNRLPIRQ